MAFSRAIHCIDAVWRVGLSATDTDLVGAFDRGISAFSRTVLDLPMHSLARVERITTRRTSHSAAVVTARSASGSRLERNTAIPTQTNRSTVRKLTVANDVFVGPPEPDVFGSVTCWAKRDEIVDSVGVQIIREQMEWLDVMDRQSFTDYAAVLTGIIVASSSGDPLLVPICSAIVDMTAEPRWIVRAGANARRSPCCETNASAKLHAALHIARYSFDKNTADVTDASDTLSADAEPVRALPFTIADLVAEMVFLAHEIWLGFVGVSALRTGSKDHFSVLSASYGVL